MMEWDENLRRRLGFSIGSEDIPPVTSSKESTVDPIKFVPKVGDTKSGLPMDLNTVVRFCLLQG